jgi:hypothetical protein
VTVFTLKIDTHGNAMGESAAAERACIHQALLQIIQLACSGRPLQGDQPVLLNGVQIGTFAFGEKARNFVPSESMKRAAEIQSALGIEGGN